MTPIDYENVETGGGFDYYVDASMLGLAPGEWPAELPTTMGNTLPLVAVSRVGDAVRYMQTGGCISLLVFND